MAVNYRATVKAKTGRVFHEAIVDGDTKKAYTRCNVILTNVTEFDTSVASDCKACKKINRNW